MPLAAMALMTGDKHLVGLNERIVSFRKQHLSEDVRDFLPVGLRV